MRSTYRCYMALFLIAMMAGQHGAYGAQLVSNVKFTRSMTEMDAELHSFRTEVHGSRCDQLRGKFNYVLNKIHKHMSSVCDASGACPFEKLTVVQKLKLTMYGTRLATIMEAADNKKCAPDSLFGPDSTTGALVDGLISKFQVAATKIIDTTKRVRVENALARMEKWAEDLGAQTLIAAQDMEEAADPSPEEVEQSCPHPCTSCTKLKMSKMDAEDVRFKCTLQSNTTETFVAPEFEGWSCSEPVPRKSRPDQAKTYCQLLPNEELRQAKQQTEAVSTCGARETFGILDGATFTEADWERCIASEIGDEQTPQASNTEVVPAQRENNEGAVDVGTRIMFAIVYEVYAQKVVSELAGQASGMTAPPEPEEPTVLAVNATGEQRNGTVGAGSYGPEPKVSMLETAEKWIWYSPIAAIMGLGSGIVFFVVGLVVAIILGHFICCVLSAAARYLFRETNTKVGDLTYDKIWTFDQCWNTKEYIWWAVHAILCGGIR